MMSAMIMALVVVTIIRPEACQIFSAAVGREAHCYEHEAQLLINKHNALFFSSAVSKRKGKLKIQNCKFIYYFAWP
jgi:hypothetical protein